MNEQWSLGVLIGLPILGLVLLVCIVGIFWGLFDDFIEATVFCGIVMVIVIVGAAFGYYPYKTEYHKWMPKSGIVSDMNKRLVSNGDKGMSEKIVVVIDGQEYGCNDTRCTLVNKGDTLNLKCIRSYEWGSVPGYDCRFVSRKAA